MCVGVYIFYKRSKSVDMLITLTLKLDLITMFSRIFYGTLQRIYKLYVKNKRSRLFKAAVLCGTTKKVKNNPHVHQLMNS